jgi:hypothetical protein
LWFAYARVGVQSVSSKMSKRMWLWVSMSPGKMSPRVPMIMAPAAPGSEAQDAAAQVIVSPSTRTSPAKATAGVTTVPRRRRAVVVPVMTVGESLTGTQAPASRGGAASGASATGAPGAVALAAAPGVLAEFTQPPDSATAATMRRSHPARKISDFAAGITRMVASSGHLPERLRHPSPHQGDRHRVETVRSPVQSPTSMPR